MKGNYSRLDIPVSMVLTEPEFSYLQSLHSYLLSFTKRTQPLVDVNDQQEQALTEFEKLWEQGQLSGWEDATGANEGGEGIWCAACECANHVQARHAF